MAKEVHENHLHDSIPRWFAVYTHYKREKIVNDFLSKKGIECYLPLNRVTRQWGRKVRKLEIPLINSYLFVRIVKNEYVKVLETENVINFVNFSRNMIAIPDREIDLLKRISGDFENVELLQDEVLDTGDRVEILGGSLAGMQGLLVERENKKRFLVELNDLGYNFLIEINADLLRKTK